jgi:hypothetical protein
MSLTSRPYCERLFHTTTRGRNRSKLGAHHPVIERVSKLGQEREFSGAIMVRNERYKEPKLLLAA